MDRHVGLILKSEDTSRAGNCESRMNLAKGGEFLDVFLYERKDLAMIGMHATGMVSCRVVGGATVVVILKGPKHALKTSFIGVACLNR